MTSARALLLASLLVVPALPAQEKDPVPKPLATARIGEAAPAFSLPSLDGKTVSLADFAGKIVVLEWFNPDCPIVVMHYKAGTMAKTQAQFEGKDVVWLGINSGAPGKQGAGLERNRKAKEEWKIANEILLDEAGTVGRQYAAKTTPHCYVIDAKGILQYAGAIDDGSPRGAGATNYVAEAVAALLAGKAVAVTESKPYGCSVKYGN
jgi:peroxiredoxin